MPLIATVALTAFVGARADLLRNGQNIGPQPQLAQHIWGAGQFRQVIQDPSLRAQRLNYFNPD